jgi:hypothetical protein
VSFCPFKIRGCEKVSDAILPIFDALVQSRKVFRRARQFKNISKLKRPRVRDLKKSLLLYGKWG